MQCSTVLGLNYTIKTCPNLRSYNYTQQENDHLRRSLGYNHKYFHKLRLRPLIDALGTKQDTLQLVTLDVSRRLSKYGGIYFDIWTRYMNEL
jgi:hypothetical protein